jgi:hypothetical protein
MALESLREVRPGMLIDHIEEPDCGGSTGPVKRRPLFMRLRSHAEARTFDELRVFELGRLVRKDDPDWHEAVVELVYQARGILVDSTGLVADPASEGAGRKARKAQRPKPPQSTRPPASNTRGPSGSRAPTPPPIMGAGSPSWSEAAEAPPTIDMPSGPRQPTLGRPAPPHTPTGTPRAPQHTVSRSTPTAPAPRRSTRPGQRFFALCEGHLFCPTCAQPMAVQSMGHERRSYYTCAAKHLHPDSQTQPEVFFPVDAVDNAVWEHLAGRLADPELALEIVREAMAKGVASGERGKAQTKARLERLQRDEIEVLGLRSEDRISEGAARHRLDEIGKERRSLELELKEDTGGGGNKLAPLTKALEQLQAFRKRSGQASTEADFGLRRRTIEACVPLTAEYGIFPHADGKLEQRDLLAELVLSPTLKHRARNLGRMVGSLRERVARASPEVSKPSAPRVPTPVARLLARLRPAAGSDRDSKDLGKALRASVAEHTPLAVEAAPQRRPWLAYGALLAAAVLVAILFQPVQSETVQYENQVDDLGVQGKLSELHEVSGGWIGVTEPLWAGSKDEMVAMGLCRLLAAQLRPAQTETIMLMVPGGVPIVECRSPLFDSSTTAPARKGPS